MSASSNPRCPVPADPNYNKLPVTSRNAPITAPRHSWFTSPARSHSNYGHSKELPLHLVQLILEYLDDIADLARVTRASRLLYYMTLPRLYEEVTLRSYSEIRYVDDRPVGFGGGSPFAVGLNTLVSRKFPEYIKKFRVIGEWREHDVDNYSKGRVPDNSMMLQIAIRAALDKMTSLHTFAWELNTKPLHTVYEGLMHKPSMTTLILRCPSIRVPRPTTVVPPLPNLKTLIVYDIDPLCYPDNISLLLLTSKRLEDLKLHWHPRMREMGEESVNLLNYFGRCMAAKHRIPLKRLAFYNLYARNEGDGFDTTIDDSGIEEVTFINSMGSSDPMTVFLDNTWKISTTHQIPINLKMMRIDMAEQEHVRMLARFRGLERMYIISSPRSRCTHSRSGSSAQTPTSPSNNVTPGANGTMNGTTNGNVNGHTNGNGTGPGTPNEAQCKSLASSYIAVIQSNHRTMRHLLLSSHWQLSTTALFRICQSCPDLEQLGFACDVPPLESLRQIISLCPKLWAIRILVPHGTVLSDHVAEVSQSGLHEFMVARELWKKEYLGLKYFGLGDIIFKLGGVIHPAKGDSNAETGISDKEIGGKTIGPLRRIQSMSRKSVEWIDIWGMDSTEFEARF